MFSLNLTAAAVIVMLTAIQAFSQIEKRRPAMIATGMLGLGLTASLYCLAAGLSLTNKWATYFAKIDLHELAMVAAYAPTTLRGIGLIIVALLLAQLALIGFGSFFAVVYFVTLRERLYLDAPKMGDGASEKAVSLVPRDVQGSRRPNENQNPQSKYPRTYAPAYALARSLRYSWPRWLATEYRKLSAALDKNLPPFWKGPNQSKPSTDSSTK